MANVNGSLRKFSLEPPLWKPIPIMNSGPLPMRPRSIAFMPTKIKYFYPYFSTLFSTFSISPRIQKNLRILQIGNPIDFHYFRCNFGALYISSLKMELILCSATRVQDVTISINCHECQLWNHRYFLLYYCHS